MSSSGLGNVQNIVQYDTWHIADAFSKNKGILIYIDAPFCTTRRCFDNPPLPGQIHHSGLIAAFQQTGKEKSMDLPFEVINLPTILFRFNL